MKKLLPVLAIIFLLVTTPAFANSEKNHNKKDQSLFELRINSHNENRGNSQDEINIEVEDSKFEIRGEITAVSTNSFAISGQTINIDPSKVSKFKQKGILEVGNNAKVEGVVIDGSNFAQSIKLIGTGQGRFKFEIRGLTSTDSDDSEDSETPSASPGASPLVSPSPSVSPNVKVKIKANGPLDQVVTFLQQILGFLTNLGSSPSPSPSPIPTPSPSPSPSPSASLEVSPSPTPSVSPSPSVEPSPSPSPAVTIEGQSMEFEEGQNPLENIINVLEELIERLRNLL